MKSDNLNYYSMLLMWLIFSIYIVISIIAAIAAKIQGTYATLTPDQSLIVTGIIYLVLSNPPRRS